MRLAIGTIADLDTMRIHGDFVKLIVVILMSFAVGISTTASAVTRSNAAWDQSQSVTNLPAMDADDVAPGHPSQSDSCHEACNWLVAWYWPVTGPVHRVHGVEAADTHLSRLIQLILPPPRSA
ncbi:hypothetical protein GB927_025475 [Shinella sp. CPCC 100929]|uniref:Uncharacterized protein n=1 Tax=Shinella lacus TaxID=2654216 RepID=A0ABT1REJ4_9HYPH|nr:hypothetical protein [Shinella lacus]MCQ4633416.1 hypothetical protein [Shinella lacus]